jgi:hypothetical protein
MTSSSYALYTHTLIKLLQYYYRVTDNNKGTVNVHS